MVGCARVYDYRFCSRIIEGITMEKVTVYKKEPVLRETDKEMYERLKNKLLDTNCFSPEWDSISEQLRIVELKLYRQKNPAVGYGYPVYTTLYDQR